MSSRYELVIFDCDGTLVDSQGGIAHVLNLALKEVGLPQVTHAQAGSIVGLSLQQAADTLLPDATAEQRTQVVDYYRKIYRTMADEKQLDHPLFPGVKETLEKLQADGVTLAVATGKSMAGMQRTIRDHHLEGFFVAVKTADCAPSKPNPGMVQQILDQTLIPPELTLMVGDTTFDMDMGRAAGVDTCAFPSGCHPREYLERCGPSHWVHEIPQVLDLKPIRN
ncbi:HAD family hydrolase [Magnetococcus sp. PR-3]|uniref:HAD family hydrolase n=1 Tax=Magnetococcus sp. PR-3 TaxID=3120355 RepID=UPI002FCE362C